MVRLDIDQQGAHQRPRSEATSKQLENGRLKKSRCHDPMFFGSFGIGLPFPSRHEQGQIRLVEV